MHLQSQELSLRSAPSDPAKSAKTCSENLELSASLNTLLQLSSGEFDQFCTKAKAALAPADGTSLAAELVAITAICQRPPDLDEGRLREWMLGLMAVLQRHPGLVAIEAIRAWPQQPSGRWWPMAADLDALASSIGTRHAALADRIAVVTARRRTRSTPERTNVPFGRSAQFVEQVRSVHGEKFVASWFMGGINAQFSDDAVWLCPFAAERMSRECWEIAGDVGVRICADPDLSTSLARYCDFRELGA